jgi:glycogen debranching enzyme
MANVDLTNPDIVQDERLVVPGRAIRIARRVMLFRRQLYQRILIESFDRQPHELGLVWSFGSDFSDLFEVRGQSRARRGALLTPFVDKHTVVLSYRGLDGITRSAQLEFDPPPARLEPGMVEHVLSLAPHARTEITVLVTAITGEPLAPSLDWTTARGQRRRTVEAFDRDTALVRTDHELFNRWCARSRHDVRLLLTDTPEGVVPYAGIPWYVTPFGRDALITALQTLAFEPYITRGTLRFLAAHQATTDDVFTDAEPGKILHELRRGEMANCREIPFIPYYGTADATPLFVMLLAEYVRWTGDLDFAAELWPAVERALGWMAAFPQGFIAYRRRSPLGLDNQGWKDAHDAVMHAGGEIATPPVALVEVQGYQYAALLGAADVAEAMGHVARTAVLRERAEAVRTRFESAFWMPEEAFYALALDGQGQACRVISSNPGHCLWTGIADESRGGAVARRLMADDMFTGWGLRTLSTRERLYNPMSYHNGSVWPHDTTLAALGLRAYGHVDSFLTLATGLFQAVLHFEDVRMPELFCGFPRVEDRGPTRYPVACSPQAWAAGSVFHLVRGMLGLTPHALENHVTLNRPQLPSWLKWIEIHGLRLGRSRIDLRVSQGREHAAVELLAREGDAEVVVRG